MTEDAAQIRRYLEGSEEAFGELVHRHIGAVHGTALRLVAGDAHLAQDVTQKVFTGLARKAAALANRPVIIGWLYLSTQYEAAKAVRSEQRWRNREQKAHAMQEIENAGAPEPDWTALRPVIDSAMRALKEGDRDALLLRFFQSRTLAEVGQSLGLSENAARMRVDRALDKLREVLMRRGIKSTATALSAVLASQLATAAPATLAATVTTTALAGAAAAASGTTIFMGITKMQIGIAAALVVAGGSTLWSERQAESKLREDNASLAGQAAEVSQLRVDNVRLAGEAQRVAALRKEASALDALKETEAQLRLEAATKAEAAAAKLQNGEAGPQTYTLKQLDQVPQPVLRAPAVYPEELKKIGVGGEALVEFTVGRDGAVIDAKAVKSTHEAFAAASLEAISKWKFSPGQKKGLPVMTRLQIPFVFSIENDGISDWF